MMVWMGISLMVRYAGHFLYTCQLDIFMSSLDIHVYFSHSGFYLGGNPACLFFYLHTFESSIPQKKKYSAEGKQRKCLLKSETKTSYWQVLSRAVKMPFGYPNGK